MTAIKCENCEFWVQAKDTVGICHRYPPVVTPKLMQPVGKVVSGMRPAPPQFVPVMSRVQTLAGDFCGEFQNEQE